MILALAGFGFPKFISAQFMLNYPFHLILWGSIIFVGSLKAQGVAFDADFNASLVSDPTTEENLNAGSAVGTWSDLPGNASSLGVFDSGGDKGLLIDRPSADQEINANLESPLGLIDGAEVSFSYAIRRSIGSHVKDVIVTGYDATDAISFQVILTAVSSGSDGMRVAYTHPDNGYTNVPAGGGGDHAFLGSWDPSALAEIKLVLGDSGYVIEHDGGNGEWTSAELPYSGNAATLNRIGFELNGGTSGVSSGFWLDNVLASGESAELISSFMSDSQSVLPGATVLLEWDLVDFDTVTLDGVDVSGQTTNGAGSLSLSVAETHYYELEVTKGAFTETRGLLVFADDFPVKITEVMSDNDNILFAADGSSPDWIELTNFTESDYDLSGAFLSDDLGDLMKWSFPVNSIVPANGSLVVFASGDDVSVGGEIHTSFKLSGGSDYLALVAADGVTVEQAFIPFLPEMHEDVSYGLGPDLVSLGFFESPTPGAPNGALTVETGSVLTALTEDPAFSPISIPVSVAVYENGSALTDVTLHYRIGYGAESQLSMTNTGGNIWSATVPTSAVGEGEMLRWRATASDALGRVTPYPANVPADFSPQYYGVVAEDSSINTAFPVLHTFAEDPDWYKDSGWDSAGRTSKPNNSDFGPVSLSYEGKFYDNAQMRTRGNSASRWEKPKFKVELNEGYEMEWDPAEEPVDEFNLQSHFVDQFPNARSSFLREYAYLGLANEVGMPVFHMFYMQVRQNSDYFGLFSFTEQINATFLRRRGLDDDGALYKSRNGANLGVGTGTPDRFGKATRKDEPYDDLVALIDQLNAAEPARSDYVFDHLDLPGIINKFAVDALTYNYDRVGHNFYVHHDREKDEWTQLAWDTDLNLLINSRFQDPDFNHPLFPDGEEGRSFNGMSAALFKNEVVREMYYRRLRTLMDDYLATTWMDDLFVTLDTQVAAERSFDATQWPLSLVDVQDDLIDFYLPTRRQQLYVTWGGLLPEEAPLNSIVGFGQIVANPVSGNQDEEFIEITNPNSWAVDVSDWVLNGGVSYTFPPGSVIPANSSCFLSPEVVSFRSRATGPTGEERRFVLGNYSGKLSNFGESLTLVNEVSAVVAQTTTPVMPNPNQLHLVISEVMYDPQPDEEAEFIELLNTSDSLTLDLSGVQFTDGIEYTFPAGTMLAPGGRIVVMKSEFTSGSLRNGGETLKLDDADGSTIAEFTYENEGAWPVSPGEVGTSLVFLSGDPDEPQNWRASLAVGGNPGGSDSIPYLGGDLLSYALDGSLSYDPSTGVVNVPKRAGADDATVILQWSDDLETWHEDELTFLGSEPLQWQDGAMIGRRFFRVKIEVNAP